MRDPVVVAGGGIGGMVAALRARRHGAAVTLVEARPALGGPKASRSTPTSA